MLVDLLPYLSLVFKVNSGMRMIVQQSPWKPNVKPDMYIVVPSVQKSASGLLWTRAVRPLQNAEASAGVEDAMSSHMFSRGSHAAMLGMPLQTWLMLASGAAQLLLEHELPANRRVSG